MNCWVWTALLVGVAGIAFAAEPSSKESPVAATLKVEPAQAKPGEKVALSLTVTNRSDRNVLLRFSSGQRYDFIVTREGREVWRWSRGRFFTQALGFVPLKPKESRTFRNVWEQTDNDRKAVAPGTYSLTGIVTAKPEIKAAPVEVRVGQ